MLGHLIVVLGLFRLNGVEGHATLIQPPSRAAMALYGFPQNPIDYTHNEGNCGGFSYQHSASSGGRCGLCGDPWDANPREHEAPGGKYANGILTGQYAPGQDIDVVVKVTANHKGYFTFRLCANNNPAQDPDQSCFEQPGSLLRLTADGSTRFPVTTAMGNNEFPIKLRLPDWTCSQCILQWTYTCGNNWGTCPDGSGAIGCGPQETFRACADISITGDGIVNPTLPPVTPPPTRPTTAPSTTSAGGSGGGGTATTTAPRPITGLTCVAAGAWAGSSEVSQWCYTNCNHSPPNCPADRCDCVETVPTVTAECVATGLWTNVAGMSEWCKSNCNASPPNCPADMCSCGDVTASTASTSNPVTTSPAGTSGATSPAASQSTGAGSTSTSAPGSCQGQKKVVCYFPNWTVWRPGDGNYVVDDIDGSLCTHFVYAFAVLNETSYTMKAFDPYIDIDQQFYKKFVDMRNMYPDKKFLIAVGGWTDSRTTKYSKMLKSPSLRANFVSEAVKFIQEHRFDGLDLDYEYPSYQTPENEKAYFSAWVRELKTAFLPYGWELTAAVAAGRSTIDAGYDVPEISKYLDAIHLMTYDLHGSWESQVNHHAILHGTAGDMLTVDYAVRHWMSLGAPKEKLIVGIPTYGRSWTLASSSATAIGSSATGGAQAGPITQASGFLGYNEICLNVKNNGWTVFRDSLLNRGPYAVMGNQWVGYDDPEMAGKKARYIVDTGLGGAMFWDLSTDDFDGHCGEGKYPIITAVNENLGSCSVSTSESSATPTATTGSSSGTTSSSTTQQPTSSSAPGGGTCLAIGAHAGSASMNAWCETNCNHVPPNCPVTMCSCSGGTTTPATAATTPATTAPATTTTVPTTVTTTGGLAETCFQERMFSGDKINTKKKRAESAEACMQRCGKTANCIAFTYIKDHKKKKQRKKCLLFSRLDQPVNDFVSGRM